jgi:hypothetical protein
MALHASFRSNLIACAVLTSLSPWALSCRASAESSSRLNAAMVECPSPSPVDKFRDAVVPVIWRQVTLVKLLYIGWKGLPKLGRPAIALFGPDDAFVLRPAVALFVEQPVQLALWWFNLISRLPQSATRSAFPKFESYQAALSSLYDQV